MKYPAVAGDIPRVVIPNLGDLLLRIMYEYHNASVGGNPGHEKTYFMASQDFYWPRQYQFMHKYVLA